MGLIIACQVAGAPEGKMRELKTWKMCLVLVLVLVLGIGILAHHHLVLSLADRLNIHIELSFRGPASHESEQR